MITRTHVKTPFVRNGPVSNRMSGAAAHSQPAKPAVQPEAPEAVEAAPAPAKKSVAKKSSAKK